MTDEPLYGEVESYSDYDSDSDDESINESINGGSARRPSIQEATEDENVDADEAKLNTHGMNVNAESNPVKVIEGSCS